MSRFTPGSTSAWGSAFLTWFSMAMLAVCLIASLLGAKVDPIYVTTFAGLLLAGASARVWTELKDPPRPPIPPSDPPEKEKELVP